MNGVDAVTFDLFETLVTEFDPDWRPAPTIAHRLGVPPDCFNEIWRARKADRMTSAVDYRDVLRQVCSVSGKTIDPHLSKIIDGLHTDRLAVKARPLIHVDDRILRLLRRLRSTGLKLGLISNCAIEEVAAWDASPLAQFFDDVTFSVWARWFLDQWPAHYGAGRADRLRGVPALAEPGDLVDHLDC